MDTNSKDEKSTLNTTDEKKDDVSLDKCILNSATGDTAGALQMTS